MTDRDELREALEQMPHHFAIGTRDGNDYDPDDLRCAACMEDWPCPDSRLIVAARAVLATPPAAACSCGTSHTGGYWDGSGRHHLATPGPTMTDRDALREAQRRHVQNPYSEHCLWDSEPWPCNTFAALAQPAEPELDALLRENAIPLAKWLPSGKAGHLSDDDYRYLAETLRAALAPAEPGHSDGCAGNCGTNDSDNPPCPRQDHDRAASQGAHPLTEAEQAWERGYDRGYTVGKLAAAAQPVEPGLTDDHYPGCDRNPCRCAGVTTKPGLDVERLAQKLREWMNVVLNEHTPKYLSDDIGTLIAAGDEQGYRELAKRILAEKLEAEK